MVYQVLIAVGLTVFMANLFLNLRNLRVPSDRGRIPDPAPLVSVLIPARNEEANIRTCLESLQRQDYPNFEVMVLDDNSADGTADIVAQIAAEDDRVRLVRGEPLPEGWAGKPHACYQLAQQAKGSWLLFVDADTVHSRRMLRAVLDLTLRLKASLLSGFPRQLAVSWPQKAAIPVLYFVILSWMPLWWLHRSSTPKPSLAIGQFLLFPKEDYWRIGGHLAVKSRILEDVWLGVEVSRSGGRHVAVDLSPFVSCSMYASLGGMWEGFVKWGYSVAALSWAALLGLCAAGCVFFVSPFYFLWRGLLVTTAPAAWMAVVAFQVISLVVARWLLANRFGDSRAWSLVHPFAVSFLFVASLYAGFRRAIGAGVGWKKRLYETGSGVE